MTEPVATAYVAIKPVLDLTELLAQVAQVERAFTPPTTEGAIDVEVALAAAQDLTEDDLVLTDKDGDTLVVLPGDEPGVAATVTVTQFGADSAVFIHDEDLDAVIYYLTGLRTIRDLAE